MTGTSWDIAAETVEEALSAGLAPSHERLGHLGRLGSLPAFVRGLLMGSDVGARADDYARERESLGFAPVEIAGELLVLGRVLERHARGDARGAVEDCVLAYVERVTADLAERARRDPLTGLLNHLAFHTAAEAEVARARRYRGRLALVLFDLDRFKETNDSEGHQEGDRLLRAFAAALAATARATDVVGRIGGDEFAALLLQGEDQSVRAFRERLRDHLPSGLSVSAGAAFLSGSYATTEQLLALADQRLYADKTTKAAA